MMKKCIAIATIAIMLCGILSTVQADYKSDLQAEKEQITEELNSVNSGLENIQVELTEALESINKLEAQIIDGETKLEEAKKQIEENEKEIAEIKEKLDYLQKDYDKQKSMLEKRLVAAYKRGKTTYLDVLLNSKSITDFISRYHLIEDIAEYDNKILETIEREKNKIEEINKQLEKKQEELEQTKKTQERTLVALENARTIKNSYVEELTEEELEIQTKIEEYNNQLDTIDAKMAILAMVESGSDYIGGEFLWPIPGYTTITSPFGMRFHPILHYYRSHNGIDIGATTGAVVVAGNAGTVITASYVGSYGNVVMIDHGGGVVSNYAHGSKILVEVGQVVERGEPIMEAGSTGLSTGPHLHFEIKINGTFVNPLPYVTGTTED